ncbi:MAG: hypothetical protein ABSD31_20660 [Candidatus Binataceae bacterium]
MQDYIEAGGLAADREGPAFPHRLPAHWDSHRLLDESGPTPLAHAAQRRARDAGISTAVCNHTFRATGITAYLDNGGSLEDAQAMAAHESPRSTKLYDRTDD